MTNSESLSAATAARPVRQSARGESSSMTCTITVGMRSSSCRAFISPSVTFSSQARKGHSSPWPHAVPHVIRHDTNIKVT